jgi:hypothetical protein
VCGAVCFFLLVDFDNHSCVVGVLDVDEVVKVSNNGPLFITTENRSVALEFVDGILDGCRKCENAELPSRFSVVVLLFHFCSTCDIVANSGCAIAIYHNFVYPVSE